MGTNGEKTVVFDDFVVPKSDNLGTYDEIEFEGLVKCRVYAHTEFLKWRWVLI